MSYEVYTYGVYNFILFFHIHGSVHRSMNQ